MKRLRVYVAGPYSSNPDEGVRNAVAVADQLKALGHFPFIPHLGKLWTEVSEADHGTDWAYWADYDRAWIDVCDVLIRLPGTSVGSDAEVDYAVERGIPVALGDDPVHMIELVGQLAENWPS